MAQITDLLQDVQQVVRRCPQPTLVQAYLRAARLFCTQSRWLRREATFTTQQNESLQSLILGTGDSDLQIIGVRLVTLSSLQTGHNQEWRLPPVDPTTWRWASDAGRPTAYSYQPEAEVLLNPVPDDEYGAVVVAQCTPTRDATTLPEDLLTKWEYALADGATEYLLNIPGQAWSNPALARTKYGNEFRAAINNAKADEQRAYNTGTVGVRIPPKFGYRWQ